MASGAYQIHSEARGPHWIAWVSRDGGGKPDRSVVLVAETQELGVAAEAFDAPRRIARVGPRLAQTAERAEMAVGDAARGQRPGERILREVRMAPRPRDGAHVRHLLHAVRLKQREEVRQRACGMA